MSGPFTVLIPARYGSSRFPGKPLAALAGRPLILHTCERARASGAERVAVATDDPRIAAVVEQAGFRVVMTAAEHHSGTDRLAEAAARLGLADEDIVVNLQGDEPLMPPEHVRRVAELLWRHPVADMGTLLMPLGSAEEAANPNVVKAVIDRAGYALYFSRAPIPWHRDGGGRPPADAPGWFRHLGLYAYRTGFLRRYPSMEQPPIERIEALEQLRALWHGRRIVTAVVEQHGGPGIDTPADLQVAERLLEPIRHDTTG